MIFNTLYILHKLRKNQWLKPYDLKKLQQKKLRSIIIHAYNNVPYYHKLFDSVNVKPSDIKNVDDLSPEISSSTKTSKLLKPTGTVIKIVHVSPYKLVQIFCRLYHRLIISSLSVSVIG